MDLKQNHNQDINLKKEVWDMSTKSVQGRDLKNNYKKYFNLKNKCFEHVLKP